MSREQVDRDTAEAARKAATTFRSLAATAQSRGDLPERDRLMTETAWYTQMAERIEAQYDQES
jgi:uncharacterized protein (DUF2342 family)